jgi:hypothetical protein
MSAVESLSNQEVQTVRQRLTASSGDLGLPIRVHAGLSVRDPLEATVGRLRPRQVLGACGDHEIPLDEAIGRTVTCYRQHSSARRERQQADGAALR